jgi:hypothetical protein
MSSSTDAGAPAPSRRTGWAVFGLVAFGLAIRLLYLGLVTSSPGFTWDDPDSYMRHGARLAERRVFFDFEAVEHGVEGRSYVLPPLYPLFLSLFARLPGYPRNAQLAQVLLSSLTIALVFLLGRQIHSDRSGLVAAAFQALWLPSVIAVWSTMQEALYLPLLLAGFVLLLRAETFLGFSSAGVALGLAALTRSMPVYFVPVAIVLLLWQKGPRRGALASTATVLGFALFTVPYSLALSRHLGAPTFIENHGGLRVVAEGGADRGGAPGILVTAATLVRGFVEEPRASIAEWKRTADSILHVNGGRLLQIYLGARTKPGSIFWKATAHGLADALLVTALLLAPFGLALCRRPDRASFLAAWVMVCFGLTVLSGFGGPRLRAPIEPHLMALAAVTLAGGHRSRRRAVLVASLVASSSLAAVVLPQLGRSFAAKGDYGVHWPLDPPPKRSPMRGDAGFNLLAVDGAIEFFVRRREISATAVDVRLEGEPVESFVLESTEHRVRHPWPALELVYVELRARDVRSGAPARLYVVVQAR